MLDLVDVIKMVRKRISDDIPTELRYDDNYIKDLISMAIISPPLDDVLGGLAISGDNFTRKITAAEAYIIAIQAHLQYLFSLKTGSDRDSISITKGRLRIDNTQQSRDIERTIILTQEEFNRAFYYAYGINGVRVE